MKKLLAIFFLIVYANIAFGVAINYHYCGGHLAKISILNFGSQEGCGCAPENMPKDCCKDRMNYAKADNHKSIQQATVSQKSFLLIHKLFPVENYTQSLTLARNNYNSHSVKRSCSQPIYLLDQVFRI
jgi:hypothetical protein